jgi:hypothetical protein
VRQRIDRGFTLHESSRSCPCGRSCRHLRMSRCRIPHVDSHSVGGGAADRPFRDPPAPTREVIVVPIVDVRDALEARRQPATHLVLADEASSPSFGPPWGFEYERRTASHLRLEGAARGRRPAGRRPRKPRLPATTREHILPDPHRPARGARPARRPRLVAPQGVAVVVSGRAHPPPEPAPQAGSSEGTRTVGPRSASRATRRV